MTARSAAAITLLLALSLPSGCRTQEPAYAFDGDRFVLYTSMTQEPIEQIKPVVEQIMEHYRVLFGLEDREIEELSIYLDSEGEGFESEAYPAVYHSATNSIYFKRKPDRMLLLHEIAHHFIRIRMGDIPLWLNEGLATYLGWSAMDTERIVMGEIAVTHYKTLKKMSMEEELIPFDVLLNLTPAAFYDPQWNTLNYSQSWGFVFFLVQYVLPPRLSFNSKLQQIARMEREELLALEEPFRRFCRDFSAAQLMKERLVSGMDLRRLSSAYRLGLLQDEGAMDALLALAMNRSKEPMLRVVALYACAMISVGTDHYRVKEKLADALQKLRMQTDQEIREAAFALFNALRHGDQEAIAAQYADLCRGCAFYPAGHFLVIERKKSRSPQRM